MNIVQKLVNLFTAAAPTSLDMNDDHWQQVNPRWSMVVHVFVNRLENHCVLPRLETSANVDDLKAVLLIDYYLTLLRVPQHRQQVQELLTTTAPIHDIARYAALSLAQELIWPEDRAVTMDKSELRYPAAAAATQIGLLPEELYAEILADRVQAELVVSQAEIERWLATSPDKGVSHEAKTR